MPTPRFNRRSFLSGSVIAGIGAVGAGLAAAAPMPILDGVAAAAPSTPATIGPMVSLPLRPTTAHHYVTRPDLLPPVVNITTVPGFPATDGQPDYLFLTPNRPPGSVYPSYAQPGLMIIDLSGNLIWFQPMPKSSERAFNLRVQTYNSTPVLTWFQGRIGDGYAIGGKYVIADSSYATIATVYATDYPCDAHEFLLTPEGTALHTSYQPGVKSPEGDLVVGHAQEVDVATNELVFDWASYPAVGPSLSYLSKADYFHINSIDVWPGSARDLLISSRNTCAVYLIDRATKAITWRLGGKASSFAMGSGSRFYFQHDARALLDGSGVSLFDDASRPSVEKQSSGKVIDLDLAFRLASLVHEYPHYDAPVDASSQGSMQLLPNGSHLVGFGSAPYFSIYRGSNDVVEGEQVFDARFPDGVDSYRAWSSDWIGAPPASELVLVVESAPTFGGFTGYVSWNGATEVTAWQIHAGSSSGPLPSVGTHPRIGFETRIPFVHSGAVFFQVSALDATGQVLGRSPVVTAS